MTINILITKGTLYSCSFIIINIINTGKLKSGLQQDQEWISSAKVICLNLAGMGIIAQQDKLEVIQYTIDTSETFFIN